MRLKQARGEHDDMQKGHNNHWTKIGRGDPTIDHPYDQMLARNRC